MQIIPVIDLKDGIVVHAKQGNRECYAPLQSLLCSSSTIFDIVDIYKSRFNFNTIYIADLNAITRQSNNADLLIDVLTNYSEITFWVDSGYPLCSNELQKLSNFVPVLGSESFTDETLFEIKQFKKQFILSLDYSLAGELGAKALFTNPDWWPEHVIIMNLPKVGSNLGPDFEKLTAYRQQFPQQKLIAAGGIRTIDDVMLLDQLRIHAVLLATALHNGSISPNDIAKF